MLVIVGHGPSVLTGQGAVIDSHTVVRLKDGLTSRMPKEHFGTRTDVIAARSVIYKKPGIDFWHFADDSPWLAYFQTFKPKLWKPSTGLCAVFMAKDRGYQDIALIGFDRVLRPTDMRSRKWMDNTPGEVAWGHCQRAENECLHSLGLNITELHA